MKNPFSIPCSSIPSLISQNAYFIDLRTQEKYDELHIKNFYNIPYDRFDIHKLSLDKNKNIYLICDTGVKSSELAELLTTQGYKAFSFDGGFYTFYYSNKHNDMM